MFKIRLGIVQWTCFSKLRLLEVSSGEVKFNFSSALIAWNNIP